MQILSAGFAQQCHRLDADLQMLVDLLAVEAVGHAGQFDLAV